MDGEANLPAPSASANNLSRPILPDSYQNRSITSSSSSSSSSSSFYSSSPPDFLRHVQAAFKRHRPLGTMQSNSIMPRRILVPRRETSKITASNVVPTIDAKKSQDVRPSMHQGNTGKELVVEIRNKVSVVGETEEDAPITPPSISGSITNEDLYDVQRVQCKPVAGCKNTDGVSFSHVESQHVPVVDGQKKVQFLLGKNASSQEMEWDVSNQVEAPTDVNHDLKHGYFQNLESDVTSRSDGGISSLLAKKPVLAQDQLHRFRNFLQSDINHPMTQASVAGSSCATTISVHATSAPVINSTTYCSSSHQDISPHLAVETLGDVNLNSQPISKGDVMQPSHPPSKSTSGVIVDRTAIAAQASSSSIDTQSKVKEYGFSEQQDRVPNERDIPKNPSPLDDNSTKGKGFTGDVTDLQSQVPLSKSSSSDVKLETSKSEKQEKVVSGKGSSVPRKKNYDPDMFLKVNGKLYQRLGKIGSGGSSEVHKVISSDCSIYALKKIRLKGRDYATAYGFCQEIQYLNKLKGKSNIIQLIDYEVTDKTLLQEVMNGSMSNKDSRVKDDGCIYMVLEYGEIDLANMLSQKWKEMDSSDRTIDENWLRFYWQQILQAVNTIHEERIVHSDLKPANFLLVKGSLKLIDFGIAKAIMSDTTNIQRDSQVGTLSYMSPEAFMCNESDANGNTIKCGRPSDIWSLGCILYQMVYGRTPFSEFKTFWAKFKVITDRNHEIKYEPVSNPWLLDIMKKCLAWDRNERWRIPELLQHPFLVPPVPVLAQLSSSQDQSCKLLQLITEACANDPKALILCRQLQQLLRDPVTVPTSQVLTSRDQQCKLLSYVSKLCCQLQEYLSDPDT
ncbi:hypothetical protein VitviT2T_027128 [Vitis vinifera]|uniref:Protein kinase domain-containing protein n=1 Tax=Vitis vinifera TaxID=29760 RepID=A0ABY9DP13_VITVI|nr:serine/threonine-protein kinase MPS1 isoform X2 [Vitis vinifera]WKA09488.1 hypothetical protein VitviT2T_027128 [Vitis vinifera]|eukprot:XP_002284392.2 PREDICTED: serine/threonine-protein kinase mph1 isoform X2 [Vitis vinifera]